MKIVVLDGYTLNPGDLEWTAISQLGELIINDRTPQTLILERASGAEILLTNKTYLGREVLRSLSGTVRYVGLLSTGANAVDLAAAKELGIVVTNVPLYATRTVAQMTFALLLELCNRVGHHDQTVHAGRWSSSSDFCYWDYPLVELDGLTMGLVGLGRIGRATAEMALAFGMKVLAFDVQAYVPPSPGVTITSLEDLLRRSDVVSLHCPLTDQTQNPINASTLALMKPSAFLINTSRGPLVAQQDLADALNAGRLAGAALDVLAVEPPPADNPLLKARNCILTPHIAWAARSARARLMQTIAENLRAFLAGRPQNVVNA